MVKRFWLTALLSVCALAAWADLLTTATITGSLSLVHTQGTDFSVLSYARTRLDIISANNSNVKGQFQFDALITDEVALDIPRAYLKVRFPLFRLTMGKTRVTWGKGSYFNAGDIIFDSLSLSTSLGSEEYRDTTDWLADFFIPLGSLTYVEVIILPHPAEADWQDVWAGLRLGTELGAISLESGYLYKQIEHLVYLSLHGPLGSLDWYSSVRVAFPGNSQNDRYIGENTAVTVGLLKIFSLENSDTITLRLESVIWPGRSWAASGNSLSYALYLLGEFSYAAGDALIFSTRVLFSPLDLSSLNYFIVAWNIYQGFTISFFASVMLGEKTDKFGWGQLDDFTFTVEGKYVFGS